MKREFIYLPPYERQARKKRVSETAEREFEQLVLQNPESGRLLEAAGGIRKIRVGDRENDIGKSGGFRFFYLDLELAEWTFALWVIRKGDDENISPEVRNQLRALAKVLKSEVSRGKK